MTEFRRSVLPLVGAAFVAAALPTNVRASVPDAEPDPSTTVAATTLPAPPTDPGTTLLPETTAPEITAPGTTEPETAPSEPAAPSETIPGATTSTTIAPSVDPGAVGFTTEAECNTATGRTTIRWELVNRGAAPVRITAFSHPTALEPSTLPPDSTSRAQRYLKDPTTTNS